MNAKSDSKSLSAVYRNLSSLKVVSRLLGHELATQSSAKAITMSREEVVEVQTMIDLYIEEASKQGGFSSRGASTSDTTLVPTRN